MTINFFGRLVAVAGALAAAAAVCVSIQLNPPSAFKAQALDRERLQSLQQINFAVKAYYREQKALPDNLEAIENKDGLSARWNWKDPVTHQPYTYSVTGKSAYRLCANFSADSGKSEDPYLPAFRSHHKGLDCFQEDANTQY